MERFLYTWLLLLCVFYMAVANQQDFVSQNLGSADPYPDSPYSNIIAAKNGFQVFTNVPERGLTETLAVTHGDGLYVAGEKVVTERDHLRVLGELRKAQAHVEALRPPACFEPGGDKLQFDGTQWFCVCKLGYTGPTCQNFSTQPPTYVEKVEVVSARLSSEHFRGENATACIDGNITAPSPQPSYPAHHVGICHSGAGDMTPWLELDLGAPTQIRMIRIYNREDCCTERLGTHDVWVGLTSGSPTQQTNTLCYRGTATPDATEIDDYPSNTCFGQYVYIQQFTEYLNLREVEVYGSLSP